MRRLSRREAGLSARECALIESAWLRLRKHPRERVVADLTAAIVRAGYDEDTAQREALAVWEQFWEGTEPDQRRE